ncbi:kinase-like protein [Gigaspora margarita]|uniref:Kinase-like protein n=1 Tax=Gigaspora margarita TaxID=4874 RepID=A0A8H4ANB9_GIGMA|nr:kinase-like protein [Gigaspora margarita]
MQTRVDLCENIVRFLGISKDILTSSICIFNYISKLINYAIDIDNQYCLIMDYANNRNLQKEDIITGTPEEYWKLYCKCWDADPNKRPDIEYVYDALHKLLGMIDNNYPSILSMKYKVTQNLVVQIKDARYCTNIQASGLDKLTIEIRTGPNILTSTTVKLPSIIQSKIGLCLISILF